MGNKSIIKCIYENIKKDLEKYKNLDCYNEIMEIINNNFLCRTKRTKRTKSSNITIKNEDGKIVAILDFYSKIYLPATEEFFINDKVNRFNLGGMSRISRMSASIRQKWVLNKNKDKKYLRECLERGFIDYDTFNNGLKKIENSKPDYSELKKYEFRKDF